MTVAAPRAAVTSAVSAANPLAVRNTTPTLDSMISQGVATGTGAESMSAAR
jgi:hypothetical protein